MDDKNMVEIPPQQESTLDCSCKETRDKAVHDIIRNRTHASLAVALIPVPLVDTAALAALHLEMLYKLAKQFDVTFSESWGRQLIGATLGGTFPVLSAPSLARLVKYIPVVGTGLSLATLPLLNAAATYTLGYVFTKHLESGAPLDIHHIVDDVKNNFEKGKEAVRKLTKQSAPAAEPATA